MVKEIPVQAGEKDLRLMETLLSEGHIAHKYAVRLQAMVNRAKGRYTNNTALFLGININFSILLSGLILTTHSAIR
jgi:hypothetical protein